MNLFHPGAIVPLQDVCSKTRLYDLIYTLTRSLLPLLPLLRAVFPKAVTATEQVGRAMLAVARLCQPGRAGKRRHRGAGWRLTR